MFISLVMGAVEIQIIKPEQCQAVKALVVDTAHEVFQLTCEKAAFQQELDAAGEFYDIENVQEVYLNNHGLFLVVTDNQNIIGSGALRKLDDDTAELKRMWFLKEYRGKSLASQVAHQLIDFAKAHGYKKIRLDIWLPENQQRAIAFYKKLGFYEIERYNPSPAKLFMEKKLSEDMDLMINKWQNYLKSISHWKKLVDGIDPKITGCGLVYEITNSIAEENESFAIADMRNLAFSEPHYHPETEIYFIVQGSGLIVVGGQEHHVQKGAIVIIPSNSAHFTIPQKDLVMAVVNTPPFNAANYFPIHKDNVTVKFDKAQFERLTQRY